MVRVMFHFNDGVSFGIEVTREEAISVLLMFIDESEETLEIEGYGIDFSSVVKIEVLRNSDDPTAIDEYDDIEIDLGLLGELK